MDNKITRHEDIDELIAIVHRNEKRRMVSMILWVALAFVFGSALTFLAVKEYNKNESLENLLSVQLNKPSYGDTLTIGKHTLLGKFNGKIPDNYELRVFAVSLDIYYPMKGDLKILNNGEWSFDNFVIGFPGVVEIVVCVLKDESAKNFDDRMSQGNFKGVTFNELGSGVLVFQLGKVHIKPQNSNK
ncbi:hypothetical protein IT397_00435 [Candidatus Nomurabacteria bacterium]|nr:hypothetical protein [Candidatus Nomurabacteria bacterium]